MKNIIKKGGILFVILCVALVLNHRFGYITLVGLFLILVLWKGINSQIRMDTPGWGLVAYCVLYVLLSYLNGFNNSYAVLLLYLIAPPLFYYYGKVIDSFCNKEHDFLLVWFIILFCYVIDTLAVGLDSMLISGVRFASQRALMFYDDQATSATQIGLPLNVCMVGLPMAFIVVKRQLKILYALLTISSLLIVTYLLNRTGLVILLLCFVGLFLMKARTNRMIIIVSIFLLIGIVIFLNHIDFSNFDLYQLYHARNEEEGLEARSDRWVVHINNLLSHPIGWGKNGEVYYIHNMWLDIARLSGILPFILLCWLTLKFGVKSYRDVVRYNAESCYLMLGLNICFFLSCFVEPIYGGTHFMLYCLLWGCQSSLDKKKLSTWNC